MCDLDILFIDAAQRPPSQQEFKNHPIKNELLFQLFGILYFKSENRGLTASNLIFSSSCSVFCLSFIEASSFWQFTDLIVFIVLNRRLRTCFIRILVPSRYFDWTNQIFSEAWQMTCLPWCCHHALPNSFNVVTDNRSFMISINVYLVLFSSLVKPMLSIPPVFFQYFF